MIGKEAKPDTKGKKNISVDITAPPGRASGFILGANHNTAWNTILGRL